LPGVISVSGSATRIQFTAAWMSFLVIDMQ
jgi:hypothetical protein